MKTKYWLCVFAVAVLVSTAVSAEQLTTVGIVDTKKVASSFYRDSQAVRELERAKQQVQEDIDRYQGELKKLLADKVNAQIQNNNQDVLRLEQEIYAKQQFIRDFARVKQQQLLDQKNTILQTDGFLSEMTAAIKYVAESEGFTIVLDSGAKDLLFASSEVDITEKVLTRLKNSTR